MDRVTHQVTTDDGIRISFDLYQKPGLDTVVIICPGFFQSKETPTFRRLSKQLAERLDVICMDFRGHGSSGGLYTFSAREDLDLKAVLQVARASYSRVGVIGFSMGAAIAVNTVANDPKVKSLILVSCPMAFEEIEFHFWTPPALATGLGGLEKGAGIRPGKVWLPKDRPLDHIASLSPRPILFIHGTNDEIVHLRHSQRLFESAKEPKRLHVVQKGGHAEELFRKDPEQFLKIVDAWLQETLLATL